MIHVVVGKPRNGKTLRVVRWIVEQLTETQRFVVTNVALYLDEIQAYLDKRGHNIHVRERVRLLTDEEAYWFFLYREGVVLGRPAWEVDNRGRGHWAEEKVSYELLFEREDLRENERFDRPDGSPENLKGTAYFIDEIHSLFPARKWQATPDQHQDYLTQHAKLNDECWFITQSVKNTDPIFARNGQDFTYCRNRRLEKYGLFRGGNRFTYKTYFEPAGEFGHKGLAPHTEEAKLDLEVCALYDTSAGVGMPGGGRADGAARAKGISLRWVWVAAAGVTVCGAVVFGKVVPALGHGLAGFGGRAPVARPVARAVPVVSQPGPAAPVEVPPAEWVRVVMVVRMGDGVQVGVEHRDGSVVVVDERDSRLRAIYRDGSIDFAGERVPCVTVAESAQNKRK